MSFRSKQRVQWESRDCLITGAGKSCQGRTVKKTFKIVVSWGLPVVSFSKTAYIIKSPAP